MKKTSKIGSNVLEEIKVLVDKADRRRATMAHRMVCRKDEAERVKAPLRKAEFEAVQDKLTLEQTFAYYELQAAYERFYSAKRILAHYTALYYRALELRGIDIEAPF